MAKEQKDSMASALGVDAGALGLGGRRPSPPPLKHSLYTPQAPDEAVLAFGKFVHAASAYNNERAESMDGMRSDKRAHYETALNNRLDRISKGGAEHIQGERDDSTVKGVITKFKESMLAERALREKLQSRGLSNEQADQVVTGVKESLAAHNKPKIGDLKFSDRGQETTLGDFLKTSGPVALMAAAAAPAPAAAAPAAGVKPAAPAPAHAPANPASAHQSASSDKAVYVVKAGDNLGKIAADGALKKALEQTKQAIGGNADDLTVRMALAIALAEKNQIAKPDHVTPNQRLTIPTDAEIQDTVGKLKGTLLKDNHISYKEEMQGKTTQEMLTPPPTPAGARRDEAPQTIRT